MYLSVSLGSPRFNAACGFYFRIKWGKTSLKTSLNFANSANFAVSVESISFNYPLKYFFFASLYYFQVVRKKPLQVMF